MVDPDLFIYNSIFIYFEIRIYHLKWIIPVIDLLENLYSNFFYNKFYLDLKKSICINNNQDYHEERIDRILKIK